MIGLSDVQIMFVSAAIGATFIFIVGGVAWLIQRRNTPMAKAVPLDDLMGGPAEQVGDDTFAMLDGRGIVLTGYLHIPTVAEPSATEDWADLTEGIVYGPEVLRRIRDGLREQVIEHVAAEVAGDIESEWADLATRPAAEWPGGAS